MNRKMKVVERIRPAYIAICLALIMMMALRVYGSSSLLTPGTSRITAGSSFDFTLNLKGLDESDSDAEEALTEYVVNLTVSPSADLSVKEDVGTLNAVTGSYQVTSSELGGVSVLHFTVTPSADIKKDTTYTVSVDVTGSVSQSDSFSFIVTADANKEKKKDDSSKGQDNEGGREEQSGMPEGQEGQKDQKSQPGEKSGMPSGTAGGNSKAGGSAQNSAAGGTSSSSSTAAVTYAGSWNNYLDDLTVEGYEFTNAFNTTRDTYFISIPEDVTEVSVSAEPSDSSAAIAITGASDIPEGRSKIMVTVTADDGSVRIYRIYVNRG